MNRLGIIGNLTRDPELRTTTSGVSVCSFSVAVNRRVRQGEEQKADYFRVSAWRELGENCAKYLAKGRKVYVSGPVSVSTYQRQDGTVGAQMEIQASEVEFLTPKGEGGDYQTPVNQAPAQPEPQYDQQSGFQQVENDELPF